MEIRILIIGLEKSGKTTFLEQIKTLLIPKYKPIPLSSIPPTIGVNLSKATTQGLDVTFWDIGGSMRSIWDQYYNEADGIIFVIDTHERTRFGEAASTLSLALARADTARVPILILANKKDKPNAARATDIMDQVCKPAGIGGGSSSSNSSSSNSSTNTGNATGTPLTSSSSSTLNPALTPNTTGNALKSGNTPTASPMLNSTGSSLLSNGTIMESSISTHEKNVLILNENLDNSTNSNNNNNNRSASLMDHSSITINNTPSVARRREYRILEVSALTAEGVRDAVDWIVGAAKNFANERDNTNNTNSNGSGK